MKINENEQLLLGIRGGVGGVPRVSRVEERLLEPSANTAYFSFLGIRSQHFVYFLSREIVLLPMCFIVAKPAVKARD